MITRLSLTNWQKFARFDIELGPLTVLTGPTNAGKSSILRAIRWAMTNKPIGSKYIKRGEDRCSVEVEIDNHLITRCKGKSNHYLLDDERYEAMGSTVPDVILRVFDVGECNYQSQREGTLYWFALSDGETAKELDKVVDLSLIDRVMKTINAKVKKEEKTLEDAKHHWEVAKRKCEDLHWVERASREVSALEEIRLVSRRTSTDITDLELLIEDVARIEEESLGFPEREVERLYTLHADIATSSSYADELSDLISDIERTEQEIESLTRQWQQETKSIREEVGRVCPTCRRTW